MSVENGLKDLITVFNCALNHPIPSIQQYLKICIVIFRMQMFLWNNIFLSLGFDVKDHFKDFGGDAAAYAAPVIVLQLLLGKFQVFGNILTNIKLQGLFCFILLQK